MSFVAAPLPTLEEFAGQLNRTFRVRLDEVQFDATLVNAKSIVANDQRRTFSLTFRAPIDAPREQRIYGLQNDELGSVDLFLVPVAFTSEGLDYEAIINLIVG